VGVITFEGQCLWKITHEHGKLKNRRRTLKEKIFMLEQFRD